MAEASEEVVKTAVLRLLSTLNPVRRAADELSSYFYDGKFLDKVGSTRSKDKISYNLNQVLRMADKVAEQTSVPKSYLRKTLALENWVHPDRIETSLDGSFRGLGQFGRSTWDSLKDIGPEPISDYEMGVASPWQSLLMIARLYKSNKQVFFNQFGARPFTDEIAYLYHQQGAGAAKQYLNEGILRAPEQSDASLLVLNVARNHFFGRTFARYGHFPEWAEVV